MAMVFNEIQNVNANFKEVDVESLLYSADKAYNVSKFEQLMCNIDCVEECLRTYLLRVGRFGPLVYFTGQRYKIMTTDTAEHTDDILEQVGNLPAIAVVAHLRDTLQNFFWKCRQAAANTITRLTKFRKMSLELDI